MMVIFLTINMVTSPRDHVDALHPNLFSVFVMWFSSQSIPYAYFNPHIFLRNTTMALIITSQLSTKHLILATHRQTYNWGQYMLTTAELNLDANLGLWYGLIDFFIDIHIYILQRHLKSQTSLVSTQPFIQTKINHNSKAPRWPMYSPHKGPITRGHVSFTWHDRV